jgi:D-amino-acid dehydrogenase
MKTIVLGGGVIGTTTAYYLAKQGHEVHLVDRQPGVAEETSFGNGGVLHTSEAEPWSRPGMPMNILRWLGKETAPLLLRTEVLPKMWQWGLAFVRNCTTDRFRRSTMINLRLSFYTLQCLAEIRAETGMRYDDLQRGTLKIYTRPEALAKVRTECEVMLPYGIKFEVADAARCVALEPALAPIRDTLAGGLYFPPDETGDCRKFTIGLKDWCERQGLVTCHFDTSVQKIESEGGKVSGIATDRGRLTADAYVVCMGSYTPLILRPLGIRLPIYPVKGVTITVPAAPWADGLMMPIIDDARLFGLVRLGDRYRCSGSAEITGYDPVPSRVRCQAIVDNVISVFPEFARCYDPATALYWAGLRPMTPSGNPFLGATPLSNLFVNAGHGHLGWTMSCGSSRAVADVVSGRTPDIDLSGLTIGTHL